jgi:hypothetical protein
MNLPAQPAASVAAPATNQVMLGLAACLLVGMAAAWPPACAAQDVLPRIRETRQTLVATDKDQQQKGWEDRSGGDSVFGGQVLV